MKAQITWHNNKNTLVFKHSRNHWLMGRKWDERDTVEKVKHDCKMLYDVNSVGDDKYVNSIMFYDK